MFPKLYSGSFPWPARHPVADLKGLCSVLAERYEQQPSRCGLLPWLASFVLLGEEICLDIPDELISSFDDEDQNLCSLILSLSQRKMTFPQVHRLATLTASLIGDATADYIKGFALMASLGRRLNEETSVQFVSEVFRLVGGHNISLGARCISWLSESLAVRKSPLHASLPIENLGLYDALLA